MKIFIFGIDGLGKESLEGLGLKRLAERIKKSQSDIPQINNVVSRGWPEIYTGQDAFKTGGFYQAPEYRDGKIYPTQKTGLSTIKKIIGKEPLLWNKLNELGYSVGIFTVPTVTVPENINGFCVAATGAGKFGNNVTKEDLYPENLLDGLHVKDIDLGFRMGYGAFMPNSIEELEQHGNKHIADYFFTLNRVLDKNPVDICFAATRFINEMAYKFLGLCIAEPSNEYEKSLKKTVLALCESFDMQLESLLNKLSPEHLFVVSDHGIGRFNYELNLNQLLVDMNEMSRKSMFSHWKEFIKPMYYWINRTILHRRMGEQMPKYKINKHKLFSIGFTNVLYLNDQRFGQQELSKQEIINESERMTKKLNQAAVETGYEHLIQFEVIYQEKSSVHADGVSIPLPNIKCTLVSGISNTERCMQAIAKKEYYFDKMFSQGFYGEHSGCKTEDTLAAYSGGSSVSVNISSLVTIYQSILDVAENEKNEV